MDWESGFALLAWMLSVPSDALNPFGINISF